MNFYWPFLTQFWRQINPPFEWKYSKHYDTQHTSCNHHSEYLHSKEGRKSSPHSPECKHSKHYDTQHTSCNHHSEYLRSKEGRKWSPPPLNENIQSIMTHNIRHAITTLNIYTQKREGNEPPTPPHLNA